MKNIRCRLKHLTVHISGGGAGEPCCNGYHLVLKLYTGAQVVYPKAFEIKSTECQKY